VSILSRYYLNTYSNLVYLDFGRLGRRLDKPELAVMAVGFALRYALAKL
jgi:hypothetical protein